MLVRREQLFLEELAGFLDLCGGAEIVTTPTGIVVGAAGADGFDIALTVVDGQFVLSFDRWEETFGDADYVKSLFAAALRGDARLRVDTLGGKRWRWTLECRRNGEDWIAESSMGVPIWRFWGKPDVIFLRNDYKKRA
ncbi:MAG: hypothetical protein R3D67_08935 [Hyphomicrobiaceae bacterium]